MRFPRALTLSLLLVGSAGWSSAGATPPAAGTAIDNTASGAYVDGASGRTLHLTSSQVSSVVSSPATLVVTKTASTRAPQPNGSLVYTLVAQNTGSSTAAPIAVTVNGVASALVVLRDSIPANTVLANAASITPGAQTLYHRAADALNSYVTTAPPPGGADGVAWALPLLPAGASLAGTLDVTVNGNAAGSLANTGYADYGTLGTPATAGSNAVVLKLPPLMPTIVFYTGPTYAMPTQQGVLASPLYVQINAAACNTNATAIVTHPLTLVSQLTGDTEMFTAIETAPNTGLFRVLPSVPTADAATHVVASGDGILEVLPNDRVTATLAGCGVSTTSANILIDPSGTVFNSKSNAPVAGAAVTLIDVTGAGNRGHAGSAAAVFAPDGVTPAPSTVTTSATGNYRFPFVLPSTYRLVVTPPNGLKFPSALAPRMLPAGRIINDAGSYGGNFVLTAMGSPLTLDLPVDSVSAGGLFINKMASRATAEVGDFVDYTVTVSNNTGLELPALIVDDRLPAGFAFLPGSARLNRAALANPTGGSGPALAFGLGTVAADTTVTLTYRVRIGPGGQSGTGVNTAQALSGATRSNLSSATVKITGGALSSAAYLFGKVFADCNADRLQDDAEPGIPGVRIYLDDGTYAVTDSEGKYSLYGLVPRTHVAKLDDTTLPAGATLEILDHRNAFDAGSQFVDLRSGEMHQTNFAVAGCSATVMAEITARRKASVKERAEITVAAAQQISLTASPVADARTLAASGVIGQRPVAAGAQTGTFTETATPSAGIRDGDGSAGVAGVAGDGSGLIGEAPRGGDVLPPLDRELPGLTPQLDFLNLAEGSIAPTAQTRVRVKGVYGTSLELTVNGRRIARTQVGEQSSLESRGVTAWEYVGIDLDPGDNTLSLSMVDAFGTVRGTKTIHVLAPGPLARIAIHAPSESSADVQAALEVRVELLDERGLAVRARTAITLETSAGEWQTADLDPKEPGTQVFIEDGVGRFPLLPPATAGRATLKITSGAVHAEALITFLPNLRPLLAAGLLEGVVSLRSLNPSTLVPAQSGDSFEREIQSASLGFDAGKDSAAARASLFLKGKILGSDLLTLGYDSDKPNDTPLFRDIQPDRFYPVYGDSSVKGYDAQSTGKLYVRIDQGTSYGVYGDFSTQSDNPARLLTQYTRALNGAKTHIDDGRLTLDGFVSDTNSTQVIDELPSNGTSGPYQLSQPNPVANSQRIDVVTRDRNQPSLVIADTPLTQFTDYAIEPFTNQVLFKSAIPSLDANLNPIYIRVVYEVSSGGARYWVGGLDARERVSRDLTLGGTFIRDSNPVTRESLGGANFLWKPDAATSLTGEVAESDTDLAGSGSAHRVEFKHSDATVQARLYAVQTDDSFNNPSSTDTAGASEYGAKVSAAFDAKNRLLIEALKTSTSGTSLETPLSIPLTGVSTVVPGGGSRQGESVALEHTLHGKLKLTVGVRHAESNGVATQALALGAVPSDYTSARARLDAPVPGLPKAGVFTQYEQSIDDPALKDFTLGGTYQVAPQTKFYATHQTSDSLSGDYALNPGQQAELTVIGLDTAYLQDGKMFDEYRVGDGVDGRSAEAAVGLRNLWKLAPGLGLSTSLQQVHPLSGVVTDTATALTAGLQYTASPDWKGSTRLEWSKSDTAETWLSSLGIAVKIARDLTGLARAIYNQQTGLGNLLADHAAPANDLEQQQLGLAYRPVDCDVWNALAWVEHKRAFNDTQGAGLDIDEAAELFSAHVNYQVNAAWVINGRYAIKRATDFADGTTTRYTAQLRGARSVWDLSEHWDVGLQYFVETGNGAAGREQAIGAEAGYLVMQNLWLSLGYNVVGFNDKDLTSEDYTQRALYLRMRFKFDERLLRPSHNAEPLPANTAVMP